MAIFSRRVLQRFVDSLVPIVDTKSLEKLAHELNRPELSALGFEWELILLYALSQVGHVQYEPSDLGTARPDLLFREPEPGVVSFAADIATVSDRGLEEENPVSRLSIYINRRAKTIGLAGSFSYEVEGARQGRSGKEKMRLKLPEQASLERFLEEKIIPELKRIKREGISTASIEVKESDIEFKIGYDERRRYGSAHYPSYNVAYSLKRNPVFTSLKNKARQLKTLNESIPKGIFLCDGGCELLKDKPLYGATFDLTQVVHAFFRETSSISFVAVLVFPPLEARPFTGISENRSITGKLFSNGRATFARPNDLLKLINRGLAALPAPAATAREALNWLHRAKVPEGPKLGNVTIGGDGMVSNVKISARTVLEILAGKLPPEKFEADYNIPGSQKRFTNPFLAALMTGQTIRTVQLTPVPDSDDDWLEITFAPDPAVSRLAVRKKKDDLSS